MTLRKPKILFFLTKCECFRHLLQMLAVNLNVNVAFVNSTGSTTTRNGHDDLDCRTTATDRQQIANSTECTPCVLSRSRRRRDGREQGPIGDYATAPGCFAPFIFSFLARPPSLSSSSINKRLAALLLLLRSGGVPNFRDSILKGEFNVRCAVLRKTIG